MDTNQFIRNCNAHAAEDLARYAGQYIAWSEDGTSILAHASDLETLFKEVDRKKITRYVIDSIPLSDVDSLGGAPYPSLPSIQAPAP